MNKGDIIRRIAAHETGYQIDLDIAALLIDADIFSSPINGDMPGCDIPPYTTNVQTATELLRVLTPYTGAKLIPASKRRPGYSLEISRITPRRLKVKRLLTVANHTLSPAAMIAMLALRLWEPSSS